MWVCPCRQDWQTLRPATTHLVIHAVSESFEWDDRSISALPRLEALTLIATDGRQVIGNMGLELPDPGAASMYNDLYVHSLPGRTSQPSALPLRDIGVPPNSIHAGEAPQECPCIDSDSDRELSPHSDGPAGWKRVWYNTSMASQGCEDERDT